MGWRVADLQQLQNALTTQHHYRKNDESRTEFDQSQDSLMRHQRIPQGWAERKSTVVRSIFKKTAVANYSLLDAMA